MPRMITLGAAQTGPVNEDDWRPNVPGACAMIEEAGRRKVDILSFAELFLTPFFPNRLTRDYDKFFENLEQRILYDDEGEDWKPEDLNLLAVGAPVIPFKRSIGVIDRFASQ